MTNSCGHSSLDVEPREFLFARPRERLLESGLLVYTVAETLSTPGWGSLFWILLTCQRLRQVGIDRQSSKWYLAFSLHPWQTSTTGISGGFGRN